MSDWCGLACEAIENVAEQAGEFKWSKEADVCTASGELIGVNSDGTEIVISSKPKKVAFNRNHLNNLIRYINDAYNIGFNTDTNIPIQLEETTDTFITADTYNAIREALYGLGNTEDEVNEAGCLPVEKDDVIYGSYFTGLKDFVNNRFKFHPNQCFNCVNCEDDCNHNTCNSDSCTQDGCSIFNSCPTASCHYDSCSGYGCDTDNSQCTNYCGIE